MDRLSTDIDDRVLGLEQAYERLQALYDSLTVHVARVDDRVVNYHQSYGRSLLMLEQGNAKVRAEATQATSELRARIDRLTADDVTHLTSDARMGEQVQSLYRQQIYQSIAGGALLIFIIILVIIALVR